jgi:hypothetical protein
MSLLRRYVSPLFLILGPIEVFWGNVLVGFCLLAIGIGGTIELFSERKWAGSRSMTRVGLGSFAVGLVLLVIIVVQRMLE